MFSVPEVKVEYANEMFKPFHCSKLSVTANLNQRLSNSTYMCTEKKHYKYIYKFLLTTSQ